MTFCPFCGGSITIEKLRELPYEYMKKYVKQRDGNKCKRCGCTESLHVHHIVPEWAGGRDEPENLITLCISCHSKDTLKTREAVQKKVRLF